MKEGDRFIAVNLVDLAITLFTLGVPSYDPTAPYLYQEVGGKRFVRFSFLTDSLIEGLPSTTGMMLKWPDADKYSTPLSAVSICKRTIWERRTLLRDVNHSEPPIMQELAKGYAIVDDVKVAAAAYALGFAKPTNYYVSYGDSLVFVVGTDAPAWLLPFCKNIEDLTDKMEEGVPFIEAEGNELNPVAIASCTIINTISWLDHLRTDKPYLKFTTSSGKNYWVKEGTDKWVELLTLGYSPV